jgi:site-specific DNA-methyltransferase (adenine-specific)/adenine-specific DNA-methyltransferase
MPTLNWIGKETVINHHLEVPFHLLNDVPELTCGDAGSGNLIVEGDNLVALKALLPYYKGKVKCIYIDPPYNTGNEGWAYNDNVNSPAIRKWIGDTVGKEDATLDRHDRWLCMMYPRLALLREFLAEDGSIWVSLDDNEIHSLRYLMNDVFSGACFVSCIAWRSSDNSNNDAKQFSSDYNYTVVYSKNTGWRTNRLMDESKRSHFKNPDNDPRGSWFDGNPLNSPNPRENLKYEIDGPNGVKIKPPKNGWRWSKETLAGKMACGEIRFTEDGKGIRRRTYLCDMEGLPPSNLWINLEETGHNRQAKYELMEIFSTNDSKAVFATPKPTRLIERILQIATNPGDLVLDSFAGSGTTGHAVLKMNAATQDGEARRFILVEMDKIIAPQITRERIKRVAEGYKNSRRETVPGIGGGFRYVTLGDKLFDENGRINETRVRFSDLARHVYFSETGEPLPKERISAKTPLLAVHHGRAVYLLYNGILKDKSVDGGNVLTTKSIKHLPAHDGPKVVYAAGCRFSKARLEKENITFKQTPYSIRTS